MSPPTSTAVAGRPVTHRGGATTGLDDESRHERGGSAGFPFGVDTVEKAGEAGRKLFLEVRGIARVLEPLMGGGLQGGGQLR